jgi:hypothetical protein
MRSHVKRVIVAVERVRVERVLLALAVVQLLLFLLWRARA